MQGAGRDPVPAEEIAQAGGAQQAIIELKGQEIFSAGSWHNGRAVFDEHDLDGIVASFDALDLSGRIPLKLTHEGPDPRDDLKAYAFGWVKRLYREGRKLLADFDVPAKVAEMIENGLLKFVSVELLRDVKANTREIPWVLDAVALLGADPPAVGILKSLTLSRTTTTVLRCGSREAFTLETTTIISTGAKPHMAGENDDVKAILKRLEDAEKERDANKVNAAQAETFKRQLDELQTATRNKEIAAHRKVVGDMFESAIKDKKILPAVRERFKRLYKFDEDAIINVPTTDVETFIRENPNPEAQTKGTTFGANGDHISADARVDDRVLFSARKLAGSAEFSNMPRWEQLLRAGQQVLRGDAEMASAYKHLPETVG